MQPWRVARTARAAAVPWRSTAPTPARRRPARGSLASHVRRTRWYMSREPHHVQPAAGLPGGAAAGHARRTGGRRGNRRAGSAACSRSASSAAPPPSPRSAPASAPTRRSPGWARSPRRSSPRCRRLSASPTAPAAWGTRFRRSNNGWALDAYANTAVRRVRPSSHIETDDPAPEPPPSPIAMRDLDKEND